MQKCHFLVLKKFKNTESAQLCVKKIAVNCLAIIYKFSDFGTREVNVQVQ